MITVWLASLSVSSTDGDALIARAGLGPARDTRDVARFAANIARERLIARAMMRIELGRALGIPAADVEIVRGEDGKPRLPAEPPPLHFNLSHSHGRALVALCPDREVGVDLEPVDPSRRLETLARRRFTAAEHAAVRDAEPDAAPVLFYRLWTAKEACVKGSGEGIAVLPSVDVTLAEERAAWSEPRLGTAAWRVQELPIGSGWAAAVAAPGTDWRAELRPWPPG